VQPAQLRDEASSHGYHPGQMLPCCLVGGIIIQQHALAGSATMPTGFRKSISATGRGNSPDDVVIVGAEGWRSRLWERAANRVITITTKERLVAGKGIGVSFDAQLLRRAAVSAALSRTATGRAIIKGVQYGNPGRYQRQYFICWTGCRRAVHSDLSS
jgi:hypothetical protein